MAISAYTGLPGSGKSYSIWEFSILPALKAGRDVWTNIPFHSDKLIEDFGVQPSFFSLDDIKENDNFFHDVLPKGALCIIDEVWKLWPQGIRVNAAKSDHLEFLSEHRHLVGDSGQSTEIILATQDLSHIASFARNLVSNTFRTVKLDAVGQSNKFRVDIYQGPVTGPNPPSKNRLDQRFSSYKKDIYQYYVSHTKSDTGFAGDETRADKRFNIFSGNYYRYIALAFVILGVFVYYGYTSVKGLYAPPEEDSPIVDTIAQYQPPPTSKASSSAQPLPQRTQPDIFLEYDVHIAFNLGLGSDRDFVFSFVQDESNFTLTASEMVSLGYTFKALNECLVFVTVNNFTRIITCESQEDEPHGVFAETDTFNL